MTLQTITPSLWLAPGKAGEAGKLYAELFADASIESHDFLENPAGPEYNAEMLQVRIGSSRLQIMGAHRDPMVEYTGAISLSVVVADQASLDKVWDGFLERGGQEQACSWIIDPTVSAGRSCRRRSTTSPPPAMLPKPSESPKRCGRWSASTSRA